MAGFIPQGQQQFFSATGTPLASGTVAFYIPGTLTPKDTYQDAAGTILNTNPVNLDGAGRAVIFGNGSYRQIVKDASGNTIWDQVVASLEPDVTYANALISALGAGTVSGIIKKTYATKAAMNADLVPADGTFALVYNDATATNNDVYVKAGATGVGSWGSTGVISGASSGYATNAATSATNAATSSTNAATSATQSAASAASAGASGIVGFNSVTAHAPNLAITRIPAAYVDKTTGAIATLAGTEIFSGPVTPSTTIRVNRSTPGNSLGLAFFTSAGAFISGGDATAFADIAVPATAASFKISYATSAFYDQTGTADVQYSLLVWDTAQPAPTDYQAPGYVDPYQASKRANAVVRTNRPAAWDFYDVDLTTKDTGITAGGAVAGLSGADLLPLLPCEYGVPIYFSHALTIGSPTYGIAWFDHLGNYIGGSGASVTANLSGTTMTVTAQSGSYSRLSAGMNVSGTGIGAGVYIVSGPADGGLGAYTLSASVTTGSTITVQALGYAANAAIYPIKGAGQFRTILNSANRYALRISNQPFASLTDFRGVMGFADSRQRFPLRNRVGALLGTSIMYCIKTGDQRMTYQLERLTRSYFAISRPVPGWSISQLLGDTAAAGYSALRGPTGTMVSGDWSGIDWCLSDGAINSTGTTIGTLGDTTTATFYGSLYDTYVAKLATWNPAMRIILTTPLPYFNGAGVSGDYANGNPTYANGSKLSDYADAVKAFAQRYKFPVIDQFYMGIGINAVNKNTFLDNTDLLHPVAAGYDRIIPQLAAELNRIGGFL